MAKQTLQQQYDQLMLMIEEREKEVINNWLKTNIQPEYIYECRAYKEIRKLPVTGLSIYRSGFPWHFGKVTKESLKRTWDWSEKYHPTVDNLHFDWKILHEPSGSTSSAVKIKDIDNKLYALTEEALIPQREILRQKYEPREGHEACAYCRKQTPTHEMVKGTIYSVQYRHGKTGNYCSKACAGYDQMAHEG